jgi:hypothetical protein
VALKSRLFEAPVGLVGKKIEVVFNESDPLDVEAFFNGESWGKLTLLDQQINSKVFRDDYEPKSKEQIIMPEASPDIKAGKLFESGEKDD